MSRERRPDPFAERPDRTVRPPKSIEPTPALAQDDLRGRRVIVGAPGLGWRYDLRADEKVVQGSRTYVPVIPEQDWYRAELEQVEVFAPLVPVERVWIERLAIAAQGDEASDSGSHLVSLDAPPKQRPVLATHVQRIVGRRLVQVIDGVERRDLRAVTETYTSSDGEVCIRIATELEWYRWVWSGQHAKTLEVPSRLLWLE
ncbi:hypothetical protein RB614_20700 [Phytohabitans sp. ZYX-F-186]|uniref:Uncharacterized protein n=1 Tax=Phytohabitans maris TaxID=3071409 RepID=A0ABU0ZK87_9ACTN|nr:hypothetical protein [Phytohabitans sp. ZYX-F-186]MDQ7906936.1 hypothetical protein [Phytohabitans sp. ZYX-F-186]